MAFLEILFIIIIGGRGGGDGGGVVPAALKQTILCLPHFIRTTRPTSNFFLGAEIFSDSRRRMSPAAM